MRTRGVDFGKLSDAEYEHVTEVDDSVVSPLYAIGFEVEEVRFYTDTISLDNEIQKDYVKTQVNDLIHQLKQILDDLED
jgi:homoaconitase/3-isopropylmalate dehydratase large subunit